MEPSSPLNYVYYFAYGSNMNEEDLSKWCREHGYSPIKPQEVKVAVLKDFKLVFNYYSKVRGCGVASVVPSRGDEVWGLLLKISSEDYQKIKEKEGCCRVYKEVDVDVVTDGGDVIRAKTFMVAKELQSKEHQPPSAYYLSLLIEAAKKHSFPREYVERLKGVPVAEG